MLKNPHTGRNLEMDFFIVGAGGKRMAVEIQGDQHRRDLRQKAKDDFKMDTLAAAGIPLLEFWPSDHRDPETAFKAAFSEFYERETSVAAGGGAAAHA